MSRNTMIGSQQQPIQNTSDENYFYYHFFNDNKIKKLC